MKPDLDPICEKMREVRQRRGWSLTRAAAKTGIPYVVIGSWERGDRRPPLQEARRWLEAFGLKLVAVEADERVLGGASSGGEEYVVYVVVYGPNGDGVIDCDSLEEAEAIAASMPGSRVGERVMRRGPVRFLEREAS